MSKKDRDTILDDLPAVAAEYIKLVIKKMRYRGKVQREVTAELADHFLEALQDCTNEEQKNQRAKELIDEFGDAKMLGTLMRRAKKRCRPLWRKVLVRGAAVSGVVIAYLFLCFLRLHIGSPTVKVDYRQWLTEWVRQGRDERLNAKGRFDKAAELVRIDMLLQDVLYKVRQSDVNSVTSNLVEQYLRDNSEALKTLRKGLTMPYYWTDYTETGELVRQVGLTLSTNPELIEPLMQRLTGFRRLARVLQLDLEWKLYKGDVQGALGDALALQKFGTMLETKGLLVEQLVGVAIDGMALAEMQRILARADVSSEQLKEVQLELAARFAEHPRLFDIESEKAFWYEIIQRGFTDDGRGGGRILADAMPFFSGRDWKKAMLRFLTLNYPDRRQALTAVEQSFEAVQESLERTPWQLSCESTEEQLMDRTDLLLMIHMQWPGFIRFSHINWRATVNRAGLLTVLAALQFEKEVARYPKNLDELVEDGYLDRPPQDPYGPGILNYKRTDGAFVLYSWGENLKDDCGEVARDEKGKIKRWADEGDWVFWPLREN